MELFKVEGHFINKVGRLKLTIFNIDEVSLHGVFLEVILHLYNRYNTGSVLLAKLFISNG